MQRVLIWSLCLVVLCSSVCGAMEQGTGKDTPTVIKEAVELCRALLAGREVVPANIVEVKGRVRVKASASGSDERKKCHAISQAMLELIALLEQPRRTTSAEFAAAMPSVPLFLGSRKSVRANFLAQLEAMKKRVQTLITPTGADVTEGAGDGGGGELRGATESNSSMSSGGVTAASSILVGLGDDAISSVDAALQSAPEVTASPVEPLSVQAQAMEASNARKRWNKLKGALASLVPSMRQVNAAVADEVASDAGVYDSASDDERKSTEQSTISRCRYTQSQLLAAVRTTKRNTSLIQVSCQLSETDLVRPERVQQGLVVTAAGGESVTISVGNNHRLRIVLTTATAIAALLVLDVFLRNKEALLVRFCSAVQQSSQLVLDCISRLLGASLNGDVVKDASPVNQLAYEDCCVVAAELLQEEVTGHESV